MQTRVRFLTFICLAQFAAAATAGPFSDPGATAGEIVKFSTSVADFSPAPEGSDPSAVDAALGPPGAGFVSLGDLPEFMDTGNVDPSASPGSITLGFDGGRIFNGPGWDLAVFENATTFGGLIPDPFSFAELAYLEVSSDGIHFVRFPSISLNVEPGEGTPGDTEIDVSFGRAFATINTTNADNLAGIHETGTGTDPRCLAHNRHRRIRPGRRRSAPLRGGAGSGDSRIGNDGLRLHPQAAPPQEAGERNSLT